MIDEIQLAKDIAMMTSGAYTVIEALKLGGMPSKFAAITSIVVGVGLAFAFGFNPVFGLMAGLSASGIYSGIKKAAEPVYTGEK